MIVEVWALHPDPGLARLLAPTELARAERYRRAADRDRSRTGAALLRAYAGRLASLPPARAEVRRHCPGCGGTDHGRPEIDGAQVSLSHSADWVLLATAAVPVGVDVEAAPVDPAIAPQLLAPGDSAADLARSWVRKEAVAKLTGTGLLRPLTDIRIAERPTGWTAELAGQAYAGNDLDLPVPAAVAVAADRCEVRLHLPDETTATLIEPR